MKVRLLLRGSNLGGGEGATNSVKSFILYGDNLTYPCIAVCNSAYEIATCEALTLLVEQREHLQLLFVASLCKLPLPRYRLLKLTHSFHGAQSVLTVDFLLSRLLPKGFL